jgi:hypothetical protein
MGWNGDETAIHDDISGEIAAVTEKVTPVDADLVLIEDSASANAKKRVQVGNLPGGGGGGGGAATGEGNPTYVSGFGEDNLAASLTNSQLYRVVQGVQSQIPVVASHDGSIVGLSVASSEARTAGTATFEVYLDGVATGLQAVLDATDTQYAYGVQGGTADLFVAGARIDVRVTTDGSWTPTTADVEATVIIADDASNIAGWSPILDYKPTSDTPDDEFDSTILDGKWTAVAGSTGTVSLIETGNVAKYDLATRPGWLLLQAGSDGTRIVSLRQDYTVPDTEGIMVVAAPSYGLDGQPGFGNNQDAFVLTVNDSDTDYDAGTFLELGLRASNGEFSIRATDGTTVYVDANTGEPGALTGMIYLRIQREGTTYYPMFSSTGGASWVPLGGGYALGSAMTNVWIAQENKVTHGALAPITAVDWVRQTTNSLDPWTHSGLVTVAQVEDWTNFTPTLVASTTNPTIGNGTVTGRYQRVGNSVTVYMTPSFGVGSTQLLDNGTAWFAGTCRINSTSGSQEVHMIIADNTGTRELSHNAPITWATGDAVFTQLTYRTDFS